MQITGSRKKSKWMGRKGNNFKQQSIQEWTLNLNWSDKKVKTKNLLGCFEINSMFRTSVHGFFPDLSRAYNMVRVIEGKIVQKWAEGKQKLLRVSGRFELSRVRVTEGKITVNVRRKSRGDRLWFELARVRVIGSQLYFADVVGSDLVSSWNLIPFPWDLNIQPATEWLKQDWSRSNAH